MGKFINLIGKRFGKLIVIEYKQNGYWLCKCTCGNEKIIRGDSLKQGLTKSCGCLHKQVVKNIAKQNFTKTGLSKSRLANIYNNMISRCYNIKNNRYKYHGKKGIKVCEDWDKFENFVKWAYKNGYSNKLTLDRINVNGDYEPNNCRWVTYKQQGRNKTNNHLITYKNETHCITEWAEIKKIKISTLSMRIKKYKWSIERALETK